MKSNLNNHRNAGASSSKSKKAAKDREKRKSQSTSAAEKVPVAEVIQEDKKEPLGFVQNRIGRDSIMIYSEQSQFEHLSEEVCTELSDALDYRLRYIINDALIKARICGRNHILPMDIDDTLRGLQLDPVYGATTQQEYVAFHDKATGAQLYHTEDSVVNVVEMSKSDEQYIQPGEVLLCRHWLPEPRPILQQYFHHVCTALVSHETAIRQRALLDIGANPRIGPVIEWFYNFGYCLLRKDCTFAALTLYALDLIDTLENSAIGPMTVSEKIILILVRLLMQRLLSTSMTAYIMQRMSQTIALLAVRLPIRELVIGKLREKSRMWHDKPLPIVLIINALNVDCVFVPDLRYFLSRIEQDNTGTFDLRAALLETYTILYKKWRCVNRRYIDDHFYTVLGDAIVPLWTYPSISGKILQTNELLANETTKLYKPTRSIIPPYSFKARVSLADVFDVRHRCSSCPSKSSAGRIRIKLKTAKCASCLTRISRSAAAAADFNSSLTVQIGQRRILSFVFSSNNDRRNRVLPCQLHHLGSLYL